MRMVLGQVVLGQGSLPLHQHHSPLYQVTHPTLWQRPCLLQCEPMQVCPAWFDCGCQTAVCLAHWRGGTFVCWPHVCGGCSGLVKACHPHWFRPHFLGQCRCELFSGRHREVFGLSCFVVWAVFHHFVEKLPRIQQKRGCRFPPLLKA